MALCYWQDAIVTPGSNPDITEQTLPIWPDTDCYEAVAARPTSARQRHSNGEANKLRPEDRPVHDWYRFVLSYPPHIVREYIQRFELAPGHRVLDPFCGTGTTLVESKKLGVESIGVEITPIGHFASLVKTDWDVDPEGLAAHAAEVAQRATVLAARTGLRALDRERARLLLKGSISPRPLHKALVLLDCLREQHDERFHRAELLALARTLVSHASNLHFGPEVGVGKPKHDVPLFDIWLSLIRGMARDLHGVEEKRAVRCSVRCADSREILGVLGPRSVDSVITSPPYPNEKDYTRTTRLESVVLGFLNSRSDLQSLKRKLVRSNTRGVYRDDDDDRWVAAHPEIQSIAEAIESRRVELAKNSGFERMYARVTRLYFGGMARHLADLRAVLRPGARLAYVVGDQASYLRVMIRTGQILASIASSLGYEVCGIDLFRTRTATATRDQLREEVVVLRWPGGE